MDNDRPTGIPMRHTEPTEIPGIAFLQTDDGSWSLRDEGLKETYHSGCGAASETWHVYVLNSGVLPRLHGGRHVRLLEVGFGTGMGWLMSATAAGILGGTLDYLGLERRILPRSIYQRCTEIPWTHLKQLPDSASRFTEVSEFLRHQWLDQDSADMDCCPGAIVELNIDPSIGRSGLLIGDAIQWQPGPERWDVIYLDAFSPASNPELWEEMFLKKLVDHLAEDGVLVTYCVNRQIRDCMQRLGLQVERLPGPPGGKREVLRATVARAP